MRESLGKPWEAWERGMKGFIFWDSDGESLKLI
jgi:hypothetical protein